MGTLRVHFKAEEDARGVAYMGFSGVELPILLHTQVKEVVPALKKLIKGIAKKQKNCMVNFSVI